MQCGCRTERLAKLTSAIRQLRHACLPTSHLSPAPLPASLPFGPCLFPGDLYVELSRRGGYMAEAHVVKGVMIPFLSALAYMHAQARA